MKNRLYYLGKPGDGYGWGIANGNLVRELSTLCDVVVDTTDRVRFDAPAFVPIADNSLKMIRRVKAPRVLGYCFTEWPLTCNARPNSLEYDVIFAGSTWNVRRLAEKGICAEALIQGVDLERFTPQPPSDRKGFVVFSGGKYEYRKGQDYVIAAMRHFMNYHGDVVLMTGWHNQWQQSAQSMNNSWLVDPAKPLDGLPMDRVIQLPLIPNEKLPAIYGQAHIGLFPNRCEAGTNMVMCEFMACGRPVIATYAHGHEDVLSDGAYMLKGGALDPAGWLNTNVSDIIAALEHAYHHRDELPIRGELCRKSVERFSWRDCALKICEAAFPESVGCPGSQLPALASR